jgi:hypothetical protein
MNCEVNIYILLLQMYSRLLFWLVVLASSCWLLAVNGSGHPSSAAVARMAARSDHRGELMATAQYAASPAVSAIFFDCVTAPYLVACSICAETNVV